MHWYSCHVDLKLLNLSLLAQLCCQEIKSRWADQRAHGNWIKLHFEISWWRHQMERFSVLLAICAGNSPVAGEFTEQRQETRTFDVFFDLCLNKRLSKQSWGWWFETPSSHYDVIVMFCSVLRMLPRWATYNIINHFFCRECNFSNAIKADLNFMGKTSREYTMIW